MKFSYVICYTTLKKVTSISNIQKFFNKFKSNPCQGYVHLSRNTFLVTPKRKNAHKHRKNKLKNPDTSSVILAPNHHPERINKTGRLTLIGTKKPKHHPNRNGTQKNTNRKIKVTKRKTKARKNSIPDRTVNIYEKSTHATCTTKNINIRNDEGRQLRILCTSIRGPRNLHINWMLHRRFLGGSQISNGYYTLTKVYLSKLHARCTCTLCMHRLGTWLIVLGVFTGLCVVLYVFDVWWI